MLNVKKLKSIKSSMLALSYKGFYMMMPKASEIFSKIDKILLTYMGKNNE